MPARIDMNVAEVRYTNFCPAFSARRSPITNTSMSLYEQAFTMHTFRALYFNSVSHTPWGPPLRMSSSDRDATSVALMTPLVFSSTHSLRLEWVYPKDLS